MEVLASGRDAVVFQYDSGLVLRRYRDGRSVASEAGVIGELERLGYPVPRVERAEGPDLVMEQIDGPTMGYMLVRGDLDPSEGGVVVARLHHDLHSLPWPAGPALLHLDLHPFNVLMSSRGPIVIDWTNARPGSPGLDVAMTALITAQVAAHPETLTGRPDVAAVPADLHHRLTSFLSAFVGSATAPFVDHIHEAEALRRSDRHQTDDELGRIDDAVAMIRSLA